MNTVEFAGLCGMYGWKRINRKSKVHITIKHEQRGVRITIPRDQLLLANDAQVLALLKIGSLSIPGDSNG